MASEVKLSVKADMQELIRQIEGVKQKMQEMGGEFTDVATKSDKAFNESTKKVTTYFERTKSMGKRVFDQLKSDFKGLMSINALQESMKISNQFKGSIAQTIQLSDAIRKLGGVFGITSDKFVGFQKQITRGLGSLGLSSEAGAEVMQGLSQSGVQIKGGESVTGYAKQAGALGVMTGQKDQVGDIAKLLAQAMQAQGLDPNDMKAMGAMSEAVRKTFNATGATATQSLERLKGIFEKMPQDLRKSIGPKALGQMMTMGAVAGPNATKFLEEFMGASKNKRAGFEAQGFKGVIGANGINFDKLKGAMSDILGRVGGDPRMAAQTLGISEDAAEGMVRLSESMGRVQEATNNFNNDMTTMADQLNKTRGLGESFTAAVSKTKSALTMITAPLTQGITDVVSKLAESESGSAALVAGGATAAAVLSGIGLRGIGKGLLGGVAGSAMKGAAASAMTGKDVQPVYVVNASEIGGGGLPGAAAGMMGTFGKGGMMGMAAGAGIGAASLVQGIPGVQEGGFAAAKSVLGMFGGDKEKEAEDYAREQQEFRAQKMSSSEGLEIAVTRGIVAGMQQSKIQVDSKTQGITIKSVPKQGGAQ